MQESLEEPAVFGNVDGQGGLARPGAKTWTASDLPSEYIETVINDEARHIAASATLFVNNHRSLDLDDPALMTDAEAFARHLPIRLLKQLIQFRIHGNQAGVLLIRGLRLDQPLPDTPRDGMSAQHWSVLGIATTIQLAFTSLLGHVIAYADEKMGRLVQDICPMELAEKLQENTGSVLLELHSEDGFHPFKPDFLSLLCLRPDHGLTARTVTGSIRSVLSFLPADAREALRRRAFRIRLASSFTGRGPARYSPDVSVLSGPDSDPDMCIDFHAMEPLDDEGSQALRVLQDLMLGNLFGVVLHPGDILLIDNRIAAHGRTGFKAQYDGTDRWLRRCLAIADIRGSMVLRDPSSRVLRAI